MKKLLVFVFLMLAFFNPIFAQNQAEWLKLLEKSSQPSEKLMLLEKLISFEFGQQNYASCNNYAQQALKIAQESRNEQAQANAYFYLGKSQHLQGNFENAINYLLYAQTLFEKQKNQEMHYEVLSEMGFLYQKRQIYDKAANYFWQAYQIRKQENKPFQTALSLERVAMSQIQLKEYKKSIEFYKEIYQIYEQQKDPQQSQQTLAQLASVAHLDNNLSQALDFSLQSLALSRSLKDTLGMVKMLNSAGFFSKQLDPKKSLDYFEQALSLSQRHSDKSAATWVNAGVIYTNMGDYATAKSYYQKALKMRQKNGHIAEIGEVYNYLALNEFLAKNNEIALENAEIALENAKKVDSKEVMQESYKILSEIHQKMGNFKESQNYFKLHKQSLDNLLAEKTAQNQAIMKNQLAIEKLEGEHKLLLSEKEKQDLALKQLQLEAEKQQAELELSQKQLQILQRDKELQASSLALAQSEKDKIQQAFLLTKKELEGKQKEQAIVMLQKDKELQNIVVEKQKLKESEQKNAIRFLETEKAQQAAQLEQEAKIRYYGLLIFALIFLMLIFAVWGFVQISKKNKSLSEKNNKIEQQQAEILSQNEELLQQNEQIELNRQQIQRSFDSVSVLSEVGKQITASLNLETIFGRVYENVNSLMDASVFGIGIYEPEKELIHYQLAIENGVRYVPYSRDVNNKNQFGSWCIRNQADVFINNIEEDYKDYIGHYDKGNVALADGSFAKKPISLIYTPLMSKQKPIGLITVQSFKKNSYSEYDLNLLRNVAIYATIALENAEDYQKIELQKKLIEDRNKDIKDSINASLRIQNALLPLSQSFEKAFGTDNFFVLFKPKDVVSGDFYWYSEQRHKKIIVVSDCTGHGVPGALMSMIGMQLLDKIVNENRLTDPSKILQILHAELIKIVKQEKTQVAEGMDISLAVLSESNEKIQIEYSGAMNPFYIVQNGILQDIRADKLSIGGTDKKERHFNKQSFWIEKNTVFYLLTDGFQDQFGGTERRKFMTKRLRELLASISEKPMPEQGKILQKTIEDWIQIGKEKQTDDITLLGFRV